MKPLLAHTYEPHRITYPCYVQPKLNGIRALYQNGRFQSRDELPFAEELLAHLSRPLREVFGAEVILDGELYVHGWPLGRILSAVTPVRSTMTEDTEKVEFHVFDIVNFEKSFIHRIYYQDELRQLSESHKTNIRHVPTYKVNNPEEADVRYLECVSRGYEGMMYRLGDCPYTVPKQPVDSPHVFEHGYRVFISSPRTKFLSDKDNRCWHLLKRKDWQDDEFPFISIQETAGKLGEPGFVVWAQARNGTHFKFGSGLTQAEVQHYLANPPVGRMVRGKYLVLSADGIPQNASIEAII